MFVRSGYFRFTAVAALAASIGLLTACTGSTSTNTSGSGTSGSAAAQGVVPAARAHPNASSFDWQSQTFQYQSTGRYTPTVACPSGEHAVGGGYFLVDNSAQNNLIVGSYPVQYFHTQWQVILDKFPNSGGTTTITVYVSCTAL